MKISVVALDSQVLNLEVIEDLELENLKALCELESGIASKEMVILLNGRPLMDDKKSLQNLGVKDGDVLLIQKVPFSGAPSSLNTNSDFRSLRVPGAVSNRQEPDYKLLRGILANDPEKMKILHSNNPDLAQAVLRGDDEFSRVLREQQQMELRRQEEALELMKADPLDPDVQRRIADDIRRKNIDAALEHAMEYSPESFGSVHMLYIHCTVNNHPVKAFIDSGAQMTIMSQECAERCAVMRLVDSRWAGIARGVGTQPIIGRVHLGQLQIENTFFQSSFSIIANQPMELLIGLDFLRRHQCCIDLARTVLVIGTSGTETQFLAEADLPAYARLNSRSGDDADEDLAQAIQASQDTCAGSSNDPTLSSQTSSSAGSSKAVAGSASYSITTPQSSSQSDVGSSEFPESVVSRILSFGFQREKALHALRRCHGDCDAALGFLLAAGIKVPR